MRHEMMNPRPAHQIHMARADHMPGDHDVVRQHAIIGKLRIMPDVAVGHQQIVIADAGDALSAAGADVNGDAFAENVPLADLQAGRFIVIFFVLRRIADHGIGMKMIVPPDFGPADDHDMAHQPATCAENHIRPHPAKRPDLHVVGDATPGNQRGLMGKSLACH